jgi:DNA (cytosine-5)-methyltransferase 1
MTHASLCSGIGAAELAATWMGWENAFWCENDPFCRRVLEYWFNKSKGYGDIRETDFTEWRGRIDVLTAGFPCQPFSTAGRRKGADDDRYLWPEIIRVIREIRPAWFIGENVAGITSMVQSGSELEVESERTLFGANDKETALRQEYVLETICKDIERAGYAVQPVIVPACAVGAPHRRDRIFIVANANGNDAGRCGYSEARRPPQEGKGREKERERIREVAERIGDKGTSSDTLCKRLEYPMPSRYREPGFENNNRINVSDAISAGCRQNDQSEPAEQPEQNIPDWRNFPTQSPVCGRNDGLSAGMAGITFSRWRNESIKAFGNGIVPQLMHEFFKIINNL